MKLIVGLGNPGEKYKDTRHNVGFMVVDNVALEISKSELPISNQSQISKFQINSKLKSETLKMGTLVLAKPQTFMNNSGLAVSSLINFYSINPSDLFVIHDDLDIAIGEYKIQMGKGPKDHGGLLSIYEKLGTNDFWHVRVGIENSETRTTDSGRIAGEDYVLMNFLEEERQILETVFEKVVKELLEK